MKGRSGSTATVFVILLMAGMAFFAFYFMNVKDRKEGAASSVETSVTPEDARLNELEESVIRLSGSLADAESTHDTKTYLAILDEAGQKISEADAIWDRRLSQRLGTAAGIMGGMNEYFETRFTLGEKTAMLAKKYGLPEEKVKAFKADIEMMFWDEWGEKFGAQASE